MADCNDSITLQPNSSDAYTNLGNAFTGLDRNVDAVAAYTKSLELKPAAFPLVGRGRSYLALEEKEAARKDFELALKIEPGNPQAKQASDAMDSSLVTVEEAKPQPTGVQDPPISSRWDSLAEFLRLFRSF